jgi:xylulokinase
MIAGIDLGTRGVKFFLYKEDFTALAWGFAPYPTRHPRIRWAEQDPSFWEIAIGRAAREALAQTGIRPETVDAIGVTGQLDGCVPVGVDGKALSPCLIWMDRRASLALDGAAIRRVREITGIIPDPGHMAAKIHWFMESLGGDVHVSHFHQPVSYLVSLLTGESVLDHALASTTMLYGLAKSDYDEGLLATFGVARQTLPRIALAEQVAGTLSASGSRLTGLPAGITVAVGSGDDFAAPLGAGMTEPGSAACIAGTAEVVGAISRTPVLDERGLVETHAYPAGLFFIENPGWLSGGALSWFAEVFRLSEVAAIDRLAETAAVGADGVTFIPALSGSMAPEWIPSARGCFYGLTAAHTSSHLARAVMEGCAFAMRDVIDRLKALSIPVERILFMGGGAKSPLWARIRADVCRLPVRRALDGDTAAAGAAMFAAVAAGIHPDLRTCAAVSKREWEEHPTDPSAADRYERSYHSYRRLFDSLRPMFREEEDS